MCACTEQPQAQLRVGFNFWPGYETLRLAKQQGYLADNIRLVELMSATDTMDAFRHGRIEVAALTLDEALVLAGEGIALNIVLIMDISNGADAVVARQSVTDLRQLKGKRIAYEQTAVGALMLHETLEAAQLQMADIEAVHLPVNQHFQALQTRHVDAVVTFEPVTTQLRNHEHQIIFDSAEIPGKIVDVLVVRTQQLSRHQTSLRSLISAQFATLSYIAQNPNHAAELMSPRLGLEPDDLLLALDGMVLADAATNRALLVGQGETPPLQTTAEQLLSVLLEHHMIDTDVDVNSLVDARFVIQ
ncbi:ABC transporter substrate-binding protein [Pseudoalteromonas sp. DL2-H2.2]|uniref:ABC transporter substrate-binding protein n=1 Tax=Pseudoalteromonas sp. DL2-H2.2 TaxID=2908889 RepID=UPI001F323E26|nr:ABC transporter substrate-binding protein [Pseudoalteromonas sp. DL2-H2.2]MCF2910117.1 ABC transporter substrate-binding protein [Pseudoalteromonas sp. DL2-H2.2]